MDVGEVLEPQEFVEVPDVGGDPDVGSQAGTPVTLTRERRAAGRRGRVGPACGARHANTSLRAWLRGRARTWPPSTPLVCAGRPVEPSRGRRPKRPVHRPFPPGDPGAVRHPRGIGAIPRRTAQCRIRFCRVMGVAVAVVENEAAETLRAPRAPGPADGGPPARGDGGLSPPNAVDLRDRLACWWSPWWSRSSCGPIGARTSRRSTDGGSMPSSSRWVALHRPLLRGVVADRAARWPAVPARHRTGLHRVGTRRRRPHRRVARRRHALGALGRRRVLRVLLPAVLRGFALLIRRGNRSSLVATSLDGLIAGLGVGRRRRPPSSSLR